VGTAFTINVPETTAWGSSSPPSSASNNRLDLPPVAFCCSWPAAEYRALAAFLGVLQKVVSVEPMVALAAQLRVLPYFGPL